MHDGGNQTARLLAKLLREILARHARSCASETLADVVDELKTRAGQVRIRWTNDDISAALLMVGSNREILPARRRPKPITPALELVPRDTARELLEELYRRNPGGRRV